MALNLMGFILGKALAKREGVAPEKATKFGILQGMMGTSPKNLLLVQKLSRRDAEQVSEQATATAAPSTEGAATPPGQALPVGEAAPPAKRSPAKKTSRGETGE